MRGSASCLLAKCPGAERKKAKRMYIIIYDITINKIRRKTAKELENYGV